MLWRKAEQQQSAMFRYRQSLANQYGLGVWECMRPGMNSAKHISEFSSSLYLPYSWGQDRKYGHDLPNILKGLNFCLECQCFPFPPVSSFFLSSLSFPCPHLSFSFTFPFLPLFLLPLSPSPSGLSFFPFFLPFFFCFSLLKNNVV